jgi:hypothetical protein
MCRSAQPINGRNSSKDGKMSTKKNTITLVVMGKELVFEPNMTAYNGWLNEISATDKVAPTVTYLRRIITPESKEALTEVLNIPGSAMQLLEKVNSEYAPKLDIELKN